MKLVIEKIICLILVISIGSPALANTPASFQVSCAALLENGIELPVNLNHFSPLVVSYANIAIHDANNVNIRDFRDLLSNEDTHVEVNIVQEFGFHRVGLRAVNNIDLGTIREISIAISDELLSPQILAPNTVAVIRQEKDGENLGNYLISALALKPGQINSAFNGSILLPLTQVLEQSRNFTQNMASLPNRGFTPKTWMYEAAVVATLLASVAHLSGGGKEWVGALAVLISFLQFQVSSRMEEKEGAKLVPDVECYKLNTKYFIAKEFFWISYFLLSNTYAALAGAGIFLSYPIWRKSYRRYRPLGRNENVWSPPSDNQTQ